MGRGNQDKRPKFKLEYLTYSLPSLHAGGRNGSGGDEGGEGEGEGEAEGEADEDREEDGEDIINEHEGNNEPEDSSVDSSVRNDDSNYHKKGRDNEDHSNPKTSKSIVRGATFHLLISITNIFLVGHSLYRWPPPNGCLEPEGTSWT